MSFSTADLCDAYADNEHLLIADPLFQSYGANASFHGQITTLKLFEDNVLIRNTLSEKVDNRVLVVDGGGSQRCALLGADLANMASKNGWQGLVIYGCIRDSALLRDIPIGIRALSTHPMRSHKKGVGDRDHLLSFAGINFKSDHYLYADEDGLIVSPEPLEAVNG